VCRQVLLFPDVQLDVEPRTVLFDATNYSEPFPIMLRGRDDTVLEDMEHGSILSFSVRFPPSQTPECHLCVHTPFSDLFDANGRKGSSTH
jgi:hypothetical protein